MDGVVTNLRLAPGQYVGPGQPLLSFLERGPRWITADMRENQPVTSSRPDVTALDPLPGSRSTAGSMHGWAPPGRRGADGQLAAQPADQGWLRDPQRFPVRILVLPDEAKEAGIDVGRSGAQANVIIFANDGSIMNPIGRLWIKIVALLSYLQ